MKKREVQVDKRDADGCVHLHVRSDAGTDIGGMTMCPTGRGTMQVGWIAVKPVFRRRGVATQLYQAAAREACKLGRALESDRRLAQGSLAFWHKQVRKGRATLQPHPDGRTYKLTCPAPSDLSGTHDNGLRAILKQLAQGMRMLDERMAKPVKPLQCYGPHGYVAVKGKTYASKPLTKAEREHLFDVIDRANRRYPIKQCFHNAQMLVTYDPTGKLKYVEGYATNDRLPIPIHHGWVTINDKVIDLTWRRDKPHTKGRLRNRVIGTFNEGRQYVGVAFPTDFVRRAMIEKGETSPLIGDYKRGYPLFRKEGCF